MEEVEALKKKLWEIEEKIILKWLSVKELLRELSELDREHDRLALQLEELLCRREEKHERGR